MNYDLLIRNGSVVDGTGRTFTVGGSSLRDALEQLLAALQASAGARA